MPELDYRALRRRAQTELQRQKQIARWVFFVVSLLSFLLFVVLGWAMFSGSTVSRGLSAQELDAAGMMMLTLGGGLTLMFQFLSAILDTRAGESKLRSNIMERLVADEIMRLGEESEALDEEKAKRNLTITDEGELEEMSDEEIAALEERRRTLKQ